MLTNSQLAYIADGSEGQELDSVWIYFNTPRGHYYLEHDYDTFEKRREGFLWTIKRLLECGYIVLPRWSDRSWLEGTPAEKVEVIREAFPDNDEGMDDLGWFYPPGCPVGVLWDWAGRDPKSFIDREEAAISPQRATSSQAKGLQ